MSILPDAAASNWVDRHASPALRPWLKLGRFDRPAGIWLLMLPGWQGVALAGAMRGDPPSPWLLLAFFLGAALMRAAGCAFNDIVDRDIDAKVSRTALRPIPAGLISVRQAWAFVVGCSLGGLLILLCFNPLCLLLGIASLGLVAAYPFMKRITWWPQAWLGLTFNWGALLGFAAASAGVPTILYAYGRVMVATGHWLTFGVGSVGTLAWPAVLLYAAGVFWTLGYDTIYAVQDLEDDALAGVKSSARRLGAGARKGVAAFYAVCVLLAAAAAWTAGLGPLVWPFLALFAVHLLRQAARLRLDDPAAALRLFKSNWVAGLLLFAGLAAGAWRG